MTHLIRKKLRWMAASLHHAEFLFINTTTRIWRFPAAVLKERTAPPLILRRFFPILHTDTGQSTAISLKRQYRKAVEDPAFSGSSPGFGFGKDFRGAGTKARIDALSRFFFRLIIANESSRIESGEVLGYDPRVIFESSRFCGGSVPAFTYNLTGQQVCADIFIDSLSGWIRQNPTGYGLAWIHAMEAAIRVANWSVGLRILLENNAAIPAAALHHIERAIEEHAVFIFTHLENRGTRHSNHFLADLTGLLYVGVLLGHLHGASRWKAYAVRELSCEIVRQFPDDGCSYESSTCYHRLSAEFLLFCTIIAARADDRFDGNNYEEVCNAVFGAGFTRSLRRIIRSFRYLLKPDGTMPQIGDNDSGRLHDCSGRNPIDGRHLLSLGCVFFREPSFKIEEHGDCPEVRLFTGPEGAAYFDEISGCVLTEIGCSSFSDAGWYVLRHGNDYCCISCGIQQNDGLFHHAHNDALSFEMVLDGKPLFSDPGSYVYMGDRRLRDHFRSTSMHNTLSIDGIEQNDLSGPDCFSMRRGITLGACGIEETGAIQSFTGSVSYGGCRHDRRIEFRRKEHSFVIVDRFSAPENYTSSVVRFHLHPGLRLSEEAKAVVDGSGKPVARLSLTCSNMRSEPYEYSTVYGAKVNAQCIVIDVKGCENGHRVVVTSVS